MEIYLVCGSVDLWGGKGGANVGDESVAVFGRSWMATAGDGRSERSSEGMPLTKGDDGAWVAANA